jgi:hypothetical protein
VLFGVEVGRRTGAAGPKMKTCDSLCRREEALLIYYEG